MLKKNLAGFLAFFLGMFGVHRFYLGQQWRGILQFVGFWGMIFLVAETHGEMPLPLILAGFVIAPIITGIVFWATPYRKWAAKYDPEALQEREQYGYQPALSAPRMPGPARTADLKGIKAEGVRYYRSGDYDLAVEAFEEAAGIAPTDPVVHFNLACCYSMLGQYPSALGELEKAVTFDLPRPERIEQHPALRDLRQSPAYTTFRTNNYRRLNLVDLSREDTAPLREEVRETLEDFDAPPPPRSAGIRQRANEEQILRLRELHSAGILTQEEYQKQREKLLG